VTYRFQVRDTGIGIPKDAQARLFTAFTQADGSTTRRFGGTGLGLAICKQLVDLMGGEIGFESAPDRGSTFWFTLTFPQQDDAARPVPRAAALPSLDGLHVLIVDDNATNRDILGRHAAAWRMCSRAAQSGPAALEELRRAAAAGDPYGLVLLDVQMPDMDGMAVARAIQTDETLRGTRIVVLTSLAHHPEEANYRNLGIAAYLTKPVKQSRLFDCIASAIGQSEDPARPIVPAPSAAAQAGAPRPQALRVLMAEDNAVNQKVALRQLSKLGFAANAVANGKEVLSAIERLRYDVILMDCQMPEMDGYEATRRIRQVEAANPGRPRHYIVALTAHALGGDREKCLQAGMDDYLSKPIRIDDLSQALKRR
jgi:CheY-like chemotaxis protein